MLRSGLFSSEAKKSEYPTVNYLWIGSPPVFPPAIPGHDLAGPIRMARFNKQNPICFWCLDKQVPPYQEKLAKYGIQVKSIEKHVLDLLKHPSPEIREAAKKMKEMMDTFLERNTVKERVLMKDVFSLFLMYTEGDYVLDSNIKPTAQGISLPRLNKFHSPIQIRPEYLSDEEKTKPGRACPESWLLFSPPGSERAKLSFDTYYEKWKEAEALFAKEGYSQNYHRKSVSNILSALYHPFHPQSEYFTYDLDTGCANIPRFKLRKYYYNTHILGANEEMLKNLVKGALSEGDANQLADFLFFSEESKDQKALQEIKNEALYQAVSAQQAACVAVLLDFGANFTEKTMQLLSSSEESVYELFKAVLAIYSAREDTEMIKTVLAQLPKSLSSQYSKEFPKVDSLEPPPPPPELPEP